MKTTQPCLRIEWKDGNTRALPSNGLETRKPWGVFQWRRRDPAVRVESMTESRMEPKTGPDESHLARTENRQLKETIGALRDELERMRFEKEQGVQQAVAAANDEIVQLKATVTALRDGLERMRFEKEQGVQQAVADANDEIVQLKATVTALRDELERNKFAYEGAMQERERALRDERNQLQQTIVALRKQIEERDAK